MSKSIQYNVLRWFGNWLFALTYQINIITYWSWITSLIDPINSPIDSWLFLEMWCDRPYLIPYAIHAWNEVSEEFTIRVHGRLGRSMLRFRVRKSLSNGHSWESFRSRVEIGAKEMQTLHVLPCNAKPEINRKIGRGVWGAQRKISLARPSSIEPREYRQDVPTSFIILFLYTLLRRVITIIFSNRRNKFTIINCNQWLRNHLCQNSIT